jgi:hypothetical protein
MKLAPTLGMTLLALVSPALIGTDASQAATPRADVVATIHLPRGEYALASGLRAMWALTDDEVTYSTLYRIDPSTNQASVVAHLGFPAPDLAIGFGSVWVTDYYGSTLVRLSRTGRLEAEIPVGLQPQYLHAAFGSMWTSNHHGHSITRVDPATNGVVARVPVGAGQFRDGPQDFTWDDHYLYVESSNLPYLQRVDPATNTRTNLTTTGLVYGADIIWTAGPVGGTIWNLPFDATTDAALLDGYDVLGTVRIQEPIRADRTVSGLAHLGHTMYFGENSNDGSTPATITGMDPVSGDPSGTVRVPGQISLLRSGFGDLWCVDDNVVRRIRVSQGSTGRAPS